MDLVKIRDDLATVAREAGFNAWDHEPDDPAHLPAAVVGGIKEMHRHNQFTTSVHIGVTLYASLADAKDATRVLDRALSVKVPGQSATSYIDWLDDVTIDDGAAWRSVSFVSAGPYQRYTLPAGGVALGVEIVLELTA